jgi:hypothetical protein
MVDLYFFFLILEFFSQHFSFELKVFDCLEELEFLEFLVEDFFLHLESFFSAIFEGLKLKLLNVLREMAEKLVLIALFMLHLDKYFFLRGEQVLR